MKINKMPSHLSNFVRGRSLAIGHIVVHYTANNGDTAKNNVTYFSRNTPKTSAHYFVDENEVWQSVNDCDTAWHCGGEKQGSGGGTFHRICNNSNSIGIEMCSRSKDGVFYIKEETVKNTIELVKKLMKQYSIPIEKVIRHYDVTGKSCPKPFVENEDLWVNFKQQLEEPKYPSVEDTTNELIWRGIITDQPLWNEVGESDSDVMWLFRKYYPYIITNGGSVKDRKLSSDEAIDVLKRQNIISNYKLWNEKAYNSTNIYHLLINMADYIN